MIDARLRISIEGHWLSSWSDSFSQAYRSNFQLRFKRAATEFQTFSSSKDDEPVYHLRITMISNSKLHMAAVLVAGAILGTLAASGWLSSYSHADDKSPYVLDRTTLPI